jgi:hypothetical protein
VVWDVTGQLTAKPTAPGPDRLAKLWDDLASDDATRAYAALRALAATGEAAEFLKGRLKPAAATDRDRVAKLIADLDSNTFAVRERASRGLASLGDAAEPAVRAALVGKPSPEARKRLEELVATLDGPRSGSALRDFRAVEALELSADAGAQDVLRSLAAGAAEARLTRDAAGALERRAGRRAQPR